MEGARSPSPGDALELSVLEGQPDEQTPLNGAAQVIPFSAEEPGPAQANQKSPWSTCNRNLIGKCKLWMVIASVFLGLIIVIIVSLCLMGVTYVDEDENELLELSSNKTFLVMLKIPEECVTEEELPQLLTRRLTDVYSSSPSLSRYFTSVEIVDFSGENATITYHLQFGVPSEDDRFMKYMMSEELVLGILLQDFHDQNMSACETLGLGPESLLLYALISGPRQFFQCGPRKPKGWTPMVEEDYKVKESASRLSREQRQILDLYERQEEKAPGHENSGSCLHIFGSEVVEVDPYLKAVLH